jgi:protein-S-isoprenylcysteine O-methyltransferase Ste14
MKSSRYRRNKEAIMYKAKFVMQTVLVMGSLIYHYYKYFSEPIWSCVQIIGISLATIGFCGWFAARIQLGDSCTFAPESKKLVRHGLYSKIRNPVYIFGIIFMTGYILIINQLYLLLLIIIIIPIQIYRAHVEAILLEKHFGDSYRNYVENVWI